MKGLRRGMRSCGAVAAAVWMGVVIAAESPPSVTARIGDPFSQCEAAQAALPKSLNGLGRLGPVSSLNLSDDVAEYCGADKLGCRRAAVVMPGLRADLLEISDKPALAVLTLEISSSRWRLLKGARVGQPLPELLALYGVEAPPNRGEFSICGETVCLAVGHRGGRVAKLSLDCQASW